MIEKIAIFYVAVFTLLIFLRIFWRSKISMIAFSWIGPFPGEGESLSSFKLRKVKYSLNWTLQFIYLFGVLFLLATYSPWVENTKIFLVFVFASTIGLGMAALATIGFFISWCKTKLVGLDPTFEFEYIEIDDDPA